jgi:uncharacterized protein YdeI (BOF family)
MKRHIHAIAFVSILCIWGVAYADESKPKHWIGSIRGDVVKIDRDVYDVDDALGRKISIQLNSMTEKDNNVQVGDEVLVRILHKGKHTSIKSLKRTSSSPSVMLEAAKRGMGDAGVIEAKLLTITNDVYLVKDISGKEIRLQVDADTWKDGNITIGDSILAYVDAAKSRVHSESLTKQ